jgi:hypothetical protein
MQAQICGLIAARTLAAKKPLRVHRKGLSSSAHQRISASAHQR